MTFELWSNTQLFDTIEKLMVRAGNDESLRPELDAQLANIYDALGDPYFRDYFGVLEAAIDSHIAVTDAMEVRVALLDALMAEYGKRIAMAVAASRTFVGPLLPKASKLWLRKLSSKQSERKRRLGVQRLRAAFSLFGGSRQRLQQIKYWVSSKRMSGVHPIARTQPSGY